MSAWFLEDDGGVPRPAAVASAIDDGSMASSGSGSDDAASHRALRRLRDDPAGRRSLTGYELRHRRLR
jgi:hypothetical protein